MHAVLLEEAHIPVWRPICGWEFSMKTKFKIIHCFTSVCIIVSQNRVRWRLFERIKGGAFTFHRMFVS
jgi:hypothetical protein